MNRSQLVRAVSETTSSSRRAVEDMVEALFGVIVSEVRSGRKVTVVGFGSFNPVERGARVGRNPRTGAVVPIPASNGVRFATGSAFKSALNPKEGEAMAVRKATRKRTAKKAPARKTAARKSTAKRTTKRAPARKRTAKKASQAPARKRTAKKAPARKRTAKKATTRKRTAKKAPARKRTAKKATSPQADGQEGSGSQADGQAKTAARRPRPSARRQPARLRSGVGGPRRPPSS